MVLHALVALGLFVRVPVERDPRSLIRRGPLAGTFSTMILCPEFAWRQHLNQCLFPVPRIRKLTYRLQQVQQPTTSPRSSRHCRIRGDFSDGTPAAKEASAAVPCGSVGVEDQDARILP